MGRNSRHLCFPVTGQPNSNVEVRTESDSEQLDTGEGKPSTAEESLHDQPSSTVEEFNNHEHLIDIFKTKADLQKVIVPHGKQCCAIRTHIQSSGLGREGGFIL